MFGGFLVSCSGFLVLEGVSSSLFGVPCWRPRSMKRFDYSLLFIFYFLFWMPRSVKCLESFLFLVPCSGCRGA